MIVIDTVLNDFFSFFFFGTESTVSRVGFNVAKALKCLGSDVSLLSLIGKDMYKECVYAELEKAE